MKTTKSSKTYNLNDNIHLIEFINKYYINKSLHFNNCKIQTNNIKFVIKYLDIIKNDNGNNVLHRACYYKCNIDIINLIINSSNNPSLLISDKNNNGNNILHLACIYKCNINIINLILKSSDNPSLLISDKSNNDTTPLDLTDNDAIKQLSEAYSLLKSFIRYYENN